MTIPVSGVMGSVASPSTVTPVQAWQTAVDNVKGTQIFASTSKYDVVKSSTDGHGPVQTAIVGNDTGPKFKVITDLAKGTVTIDQYGQSGNLNGRYATITDTERRPWPSVTSGNMSVQDLPFGESIDSQDPTNPNDVRVVVGDAAFDNANPDPFANGAVPGDYTPGSLGPDVSIATPPQRSTQGVWNGPDPMPLTVGGDGMWDVLNVNTGNVIHDKWTMTSSFYSADARSTQTFQSSADTLWNWVNDFKPWKW